MAFAHTALTDNTIENITIYSPVNLEPNGFDDNGNGKYNIFANSYTKNLKTFTTYSDFGYEDTSQLLDNLFGIDGPGRQNVTINLMA